MKRDCCVLWMLFFSFSMGEAQETRTAVLHPELTLEKIMADPKWIGSSPRSVRWSADSRTVYFEWNPEQGPADSLYCVPRSGGRPVKASAGVQRELPFRYGDESPDGRLKVYEKDGDIAILDIPSMKSRKVTETAEAETSPRFVQDGKKISFIKEGNLYLWSIEDGAIRQVTDFRQGEAPSEESRATAQEQWLARQEKKLFSAIAKKEDRRPEARDGHAGAGSARILWMGDRVVQNLQISPDCRFVTFQWTAQPRNVRRTRVPSYVTESGFTEELPSRSKVGAPEGRSEFRIYDTLRDTVMTVSVNSIPGITDIPAYRSEYTMEQDMLPAASLDAGRSRKKETRSVRFSTPVWSRDGKSVVVAVNALDNKDRWIMLLDPENAAIEMLDRQHDDAWIGGPGIGGWGGGGVGWLPDNRRIWFISEESGYAHLTVLDTKNRSRKALTSGSYEVYDVSLSKDGRCWYFTANRTHPGERHFYRMPLEGGNPERITTSPGFHEVALSPDEKTIADLYSTVNTPWELYLAQNRTGAKALRVTQSTTASFESYPWRDAEIISYSARDGATVYARLFRPDTLREGLPAVLFVHGAGYLQDAHRGWSTYFREYLFHNFLTDRGYWVMDIDYRGSAGYGRDWRTGIYRDMGGKDLEDLVDGVRYLVRMCGADPGRIGLYGGSYGGFLTLMAMFKQPDVFRAGAALRPVTDWSHYNHGYTSDILNIPTSDSLAYIRSSPIYHAEGLKGALLICHGMVDDNVHFQDTARLAQRLIELGKENWEVALYPVESHGFTEPSSWLDEYRRIYRLFEENLRR